MAAFLTRALGLGPADRDYFGDDTGSIFEDFINRLAASGITTGCGTTMFCPDSNITREQMAAFLVRGYGYCDAGTDRFSDDKSSPFEADINRLAQAGITTGCATSRFCPLDPVLRDQMATFLTRAEVLDPIPVEAGCSILPADNIWNTPIDNLPVHALSAQYISSIGISTTLHPDFGSGVWRPGSTSPIGIPNFDISGL